MNPTQVSADFYSAGQISLQDVQSIAAQGFKTIINCRPDGEDGPAQPTAAQIREAAEKCGLHYYHFPVAMGTSGAEYVAAMAAALARAPKPVLGFCRSGTRAGNLYKAAA